LAVFFKNVLTLCVFANRFDWYVVGLLWLWVCDNGFGDSGCCRPVWWRVSASVDVPFHLCIDHICNVYYKHASSSSHTSVRPLLGCCADILRNTELLYSVI